MILFSAPSFPRKKESLLLLFRELFEILLLLVRNDRNDYPSLQADGGMGGWVGGPLRRGVGWCVWISSRQSRFWAWPYLNRVQKS